MTISKQGGAADSRASAMPLAVCVVLYWSCAPEITACQRRGGRGTEGTTLMGSSTDLHANASALTVQLLVANQARWSKTLTRVSTRGLTLFWPVSVMPLLTTRYLPTMAAECSSLASGMMPTTLTFVRTVHQSPAALCPDHLNNLVRPHHTLLHCMVRH